jgi:hypothetical protein
MMRLLFIVLDSALKTIDPGLRFEEYDCPIFRIGTYNFDTRTLAASRASSGAETSGPKHQALGHRQTADYYSHCCNVGKIIINHPFGNGL